MTFADWVALLLIGSTAASALLYALDFSRGRR